MNSAHSILLDGEYLVAQGTTVGMFTTTITLMVI